MTNWLDDPRLIRWLTGRSMQTDAAKLGDLTLSMLQGADGPQAAEVKRLAEWLRASGSQLVHFSNLLIAGCAPTIKQQLGIPVLVTLQGDDLFLGDLTDEYQERAFAKIHEVDRFVDKYLVHSDFYAGHMANFLGLERTKFQKIPLAISTHDWTDVTTPTTTERPPTVGYMARLAPEKGLHLLCEAFELLRQRPATKDARLIIAGWLGTAYRPTVEDLFQRLSEKCSPHSFEFRGTVTRAEKRQLFHEVDVLSVPTTFLEPKGLYVLEALAAETPVVQPAHGIFPELIAATGGGLLCKPNDPVDLADKLEELLTDESRRRQLGTVGRARVLEHHSVKVAADALRDVYQSQL